MRAASARVPRGPRPAGHTCARAPAPGLGPLSGSRHPRPGHVSAGAAGRWLSRQPRRTAASGNQKPPGRESPGGWRRGANPTQRGLLAAARTLGAAGIPRAVGPGWVDVSTAERAPCPGRGRADPFLAADSDPISSACGLRWRPPAHPPRSPKLRRGVRASCRRRRRLEGRQQPLGAASEIVSGVRGALGRWSFEARPGLRPALSAQQIPEGGGREGRGACPPSSRLGNN